MGAIDNSRGGAAADEEEPAEKSRVLIVMGDGRYGSMLERFLCQMHTRNFDTIVGLVDDRYRESASGTSGAAPGRRAEGGEAAAASSETEEDDEGEEPSSELPDNCKVEYVDFHRIYTETDEELARVIRDYRIDWMCLVPFGNTFHRPDEVTVFLKSYKENRGRNVLLLSSVGADSPKVPLSDLKACEDAVRTQFPTMNCVLRVQVPMEDLDYFGRAVRHEKTWRLPTGDGSFAPVSFKEDVVFASAVIMTPKTMDRAHADRVYTLTGGGAINGISLAQMTGVAFDERGVKFAAITTDEARGIVQREIDRSKKAAAPDRGGGDGGGWWARFLASNFGRAPGDRPAAGRPSSAGAGGIDVKYTSKVEREIMLNRFELAQEHQMDVVTNDVRDITGRVPVTVPAYLRSNEGSFKGKN